jgi:holo-[acyl-carrier protein] synthase
MIKGVGIDIVEISRIKKIIKANGKRFLQRTFTENEINYANSFLNMAERLAGRFAAKEAVIKATGKKISMKKIEVLNNADGKPYVNIPGVQISISHEKNYAVAIALYEEE